MAAHRLACGLGLRVWKGSGSAHRTVVIAGALGVKQRFYEKYAAHLSSEGLNAVTFDYVGVGASKPEGYEHATLDDWATNQDDVLGTRRTSSTDRSRSSATASARNSSGRSRAAAASTAS